MWALLRCCTVATALAVLALGLSPARADDPEPEGAPGASAYTQQVRQGALAVMAREFSRAQNQLRRASEQSPDRPEAYYYLAQLHRVQNQARPAIENFKACASAAKQNEEPKLAAWCLQGLASTLEQNPETLEEAKAAWNEYLTFANANPQAAQPEIARTRVRAIDKKLQQDAAYVAVRERIKG